MSRIIEYFLNNGRFSRARLEKCLTKEPAPGAAEEREVIVTEGEKLIKEGLVTEEELAKAYCLVSSRPFANIGAMRLDKSLFELIPPETAQKYGVVPFGEDDGALRLAMKDVTDLIAIEKAAAYSGMRIKPYVAYPSAVNSALSAAYGEKKSSLAAEDMSRDIEEAGAETEDALDDGDESSATVRYVNSLINRGITQGASDIHIEASEQETVARLRVDGVLRDIQTAPSVLHEAIVARVKVMGGMDVSQKRVPQDGRGTYMLDGEKTDLRISTLPAVFGEKIVIRLLRKSLPIADRGAIGLTKENAAVYEKMLRNKSGLILLSGPTGSGKSTTMLTMIKTLNSRDINIITLEDPVEYNVEGITQVQINEKTGMTFPAALRASLRQDPDVICVGEIRDEQTAQIAVRAAITGHLVISTIHTSDAPGAVERLRDMGVESYLAASALRGVISQRLVRKLCPYCRRKTAPDDAEKKLFERWNIDPPNAVFRAAGCQRCFNLGYSGRKGVFELLLTDGRLSEMIAAGDSARALRTEAEKTEGFERMPGSCLALAAAGETSLEEVGRVMSLSDW
ncbi:MAG: type II/IV secretion system protein [Lachnospiraceae bacterium]|nr:type II/IV secretion system protein [Lachnospiraceae bacterium]